MRQALYHFVIVLLFLTSAYGWGRLFSFAIDRRILAVRSATAIMGLAALGVVGGILNVFHLATEPVLAVTIFVGCGSATWHLVRTRPWQRFRGITRASIPLLLAPVIAAGAALLLMPSSAFNIGDDFQNYVTRAVRMAQTGSLAGNAFDLLGVDSLGSPSFFHGFFLLAGGVPLLNGFDAVACFALCLLLLAELSMRWRLPWWLGVSAVAGLTWMNPQIVNISAVYAGAAGIMVLVLCGILLARSLARTQTSPVRRIGLSMGLVTGWLAAMKLTIAVFAGLFFLLLLAVLFLTTVKRRALFNVTIATCVTMAAGVVPWGLVTWPDLLRARQISDPLASLAPLADKYPSIAARQSGLLIEPVPLLYGNTPLLYLVVCVAALAIAVAGFTYWLRHRTQSRLAAMPAMIAAGLALIGTLYLNSHMFPITPAIRYVCPAVLGTVFFLALAFVSIRTAVPAPSRRWLSAGMTAGCLAVLVGFHGTFLERFQKAVQSRTLIAYRTDDAYLRQCQQMMSGNERAYYLGLQAQIPAGSTALVWTTTPFHFDFNRNQLLITSLGGVVSPALRFPAGLAPDAFENYLLSNNIRYVIFETNGYGVAKRERLARMQQNPLPFYQKLGDFGDYAMTVLEQLSRQTKVIYSDDRMVLYELKNAHSREAGSSRVSSL